MIPYAATHNLRLVLLNLRDYPGSTRYSPEELASLASPTREVQDAAIQARGHEIVAFLRWFIETERIPPISERQGLDLKHCGGISLLGWSSGNCQMISVLAHADKLPEDTRVLLDAYFRSFILHGACCRLVFRSAGLFNQRGFVRDLFRFVSDSHWLGSTRRLAWPIPQSGPFIRRPCA